VAKTGSFRLDFSIGQTIREILVLKAIQKFLLELPFASLAFVTLACYPGGNGGLRVILLLLRRNITFAFGYRA
jgi:hypothetical protein